MTYEEVVAGLRDSNRELQTEGRLVRAGLKAEQEFAPIMARYSWLYSDEALAVVDRSPDLGGLAGEARRRVRIAILQGIIDRRTAAAQDRQQTFYASEAALVGGESIPFYTAQSQLGREPDPRRREALGEAAAEVMARAGELELELAAQTMEVIRGFGHDTYLGFWSDVKGIDYAALRAELERVAAACADAYRGWIEPRMESYGWRFGECPAWHTSFTRGIPEHDRVFTAERMEPAMRQTFGALGLELFDSPAIHIDIEDRPSKNPRASVWIPDAGVDVHLLTRPSGGNLDYSAFLHEAGHALHFGLTDPGLDWPLRNLGRSMAYAELWSFLFERIGHDPQWLRGAVGVGSEEAAAITDALTGVDLMMFVRYVGKLAYELDLYSGDPLDAHRGRQLYASTMSERTGFRHDQRPWQHDRDPGLYSADYLRAWMAEAALRSRLRERFGARWWSSARAGEWLRAQWRMGWIPEAEETVADAGGVPWSGDALIESLSRPL